jgi:beta-N-acetylhexosaminidase
VSVHLRRRLALGGGVALLAIVVALVAVALSSGSSGDHPRYVLGGAGPAISHIANPSPPRGPSSSPNPRSTRPTRPRPFRPAAAATTAAGALTLPQQVAQLFLVTLDGTDSTAVATLAPTDWGGVVFTRANFATDGQIGALAADVTASARTTGATPPLLAVTQEGGPQTAIADLPPEGEQEIGAGPDPAHDARLAHSQALLAAARLRALGFTMTLAPLADVDTPSGALNGRLFSTDPATVADLSAAAVDGYHAGGLIAAAGHFPGEGGASADPDLSTATVGGSLGSLRARDLVPFTRIAPAVPVIVMSNATYVAFDGVTPAGLLPAAVRLLRNGYGFQGVVMSDDLDATLNVTGLAPGPTAVAALNAGDDLLYISGPASERNAAYDAVLAAAQRSPAVRALVKQALLRDLTLKSAYGLLH